MKYSKQELEAFRIIAHKGPVPNCKGCETKVRKSWNVVSQYFTDSERRNLSIAESHAKFTHEGRGEWDRVIGVIYDRLGIDSEDVPRGSKTVSATK